jgi:hypothetical protein
MVTKTLRRAGRWDVSSGLSMDFHAPNGQSTVLLDGFLRELAWVHDNGYRPLGRRLRSLSTLDTFQPLESVAAPIRTCALIGVWRAQRYLN